MASRQPLSIQPPSGARLFAETRAVPEWFRFALSAMVAFAKHEPIASASSRLAFTITIASST